MKGFSIKEYNKIISDKKFNTWSRAARKAFSESTFLTEKELEKNLEKELDFDRKQIDKVISKLEEVNLIQKISEPKFKSVKDSEEVQITVKDIVLDINMPTHKKKDGPKVRYAKRGYEQILGINKYKKAHYYYSPKSYSFLKYFVENFHFIMDSDKLKEFKITKDSVNHFYHSKLIPVIRSIEFATSVEIKLHADETSLNYEKDLPKECENSIKLQKEFNKLYEQVGLGISSKDFVEEYVNDIFDYTCTVEKTISEYKKIIA